MKKKNWLPLILMIAGIVILAIGVWKISYANIKTNETLAKAKQVIAGNKKDSQKQEKQEQQVPQTQPEKSKPALVGDTIGILEIPKIKAELAIVEGTDPDDLEKGVGHYKGSSMPKEHGQIVLSGHRDTVFRKLGELKVGDSLNIQTSNGSFTYKINRTRIVGAKDTSIITLQKEKEELILTTCYPFRYIGNAPKRYIIYAQPI